MSVAINKLDLLPAYQAEAERIGMVGGPDAQLSDRDVANYYSYHPTNDDIPPDFLRNTVAYQQQQRADLLKLTPARMQQIAEDRAAEIERSGTGGQLYNHPIKSGLAERRRGNWREAELYAFYGAPVTPLMKAASADGVITAEEREQIARSTPDPAEARLRQITAESLAIEQRRLLGNLARDNLLGIAPSRVGLEPPKVDYKAAITDFVARAKAEAVSIVLDSRYGSKTLDQFLPESLKGFPNHSLFGYEQFDADAIADKILVKWDAPSGPSSVSGQRILYAMLTTDNQRISSELKGDVSKAVVAKMTREQAQSLTPMMLTALCAWPRYATAERYQAQFKDPRATPDEQAARLAGYPYERVDINIDRGGAIASQKTRGPQFHTYDLSDSPLLVRLRELTKDTLEWDRNRGWVRQSGDAE